MRCIREKSGTFRGYHVINPVAFEYDRCFLPTALHHTGVFAGMMEKVIRQFRNMDRTVIFRGIKMIGFAVIVNKQCHIPNALTALKIPSDDRTFFDPVTPFRTAIFPLRTFRDPFRVFIARSHIHGPNSFFRPFRIQKFKRSEGRIRDGDTHIRPGMIFIGTVEIHHKFFCFCAENHFRTFHTFPAEKRTFRIVNHVKRTPAVGPVFKIG